MSYIAKTILSLYILLVFNFTYCSENESFENEKKRIDLFLQNKAPGLEMSYQDFFNLLLQEKIAIVLHGGTTRDLLSEGFKKPRDLDFTFFCSKDIFEQALDKHQIPYFSIPKMPLVIIGSIEGTYLEGYSTTWNNRMDPCLQEFTVNSVIYNLDTRQFVEPLEPTLNDIKNKRLRLQTTDWNGWLLDGSQEFPLKIFRFFKMVGKGYIYQVSFENFIKNEILILSSNKKKFKENVINYLGYHESSIREIEHGAKTVMGEEWFEENMLPYYDDIHSKALESKTLLTSHFKKMQEEQKPCSYSH